MECRGRLVREERSITTGKYGGRPSALDGHVGTTDGVDALMNAVQLPSGHALTNRARTKADRQELPQSDDSVLLSGNRHDQPVDSVLWRTMDGFRRHS